MTAFLSALQNSALAVWVVESESILAYPTILTLHTVGLALCVGASTVLALRTVGAGSRLPFAVFRRVGTPFWLGFAINASSGLLLFAASAEVNGVRPLFFLKLSLIGLAMMAHVRLSRVVFTEPVAGSGRAPIGARPWAWLALLFWLGAIVAGRLMAYL